MPEGVRAIYREALAARYGLILSAGPAGAGKTSTLQAGLEILSGTRQVSEPAQATGKDSLSVLLRADPDVVMAGEIADRDVAEAALDAACEGRLVLASITVPGAVAALARLFELRAEPFQIACSLRAVIAQRRARRLCPLCREPVQASGSAAALLGFDSGTIVYEPRGCADCGGSGYCGTIALFEAIRADLAMRRLINGGGDAAVIANQAFRNAPDLGAAARASVRRGETSVAEAVRLSRSAESDRRGTRPAEAG